MRRLVSSVVPDAGARRWCPGHSARHATVFREWRDMGVVIYIALTVAIFGLLGLVQKLVERL